MSKQARSLRPGDRVRVVVDHLGPDGLGRARLETDPRVVVVEDGLPGETGEAMVLHAGSRVAVRLLEPAEEAPSRRVPPCPRWTPASPCRLMHLSAEAQAEEKSRRVAEALAAHGVEAPVEATWTPSPPLGWRARATFVAARDRAGALVLGAYRRGSHVVQDMTGCLIEEPAVSEAAAALRAALVTLKVPVADPGLPVAPDGGCGAPLELEALEAAVRKGRQQPRTPRLVDDGLRYAVLRANVRGETAVALLTPGGTLASADALAEALHAALPGLTGVWVGPSGAGDALFGGPLTAVGPARPLVERLGGLGFEVSPAAFFQVNRAAADALHGLAAEHAGTGRVVDVYSGVGALSLRMAAAGAEVVGVESYADAVADADHNAGLAGLTERARFRCADAAEGLRAVLDEGFRPATVVVNPPRKGCAKAVLEAIDGAGAEAVVYVSCNPDSLARDLAVLTGAGWRLERVSPFDLFPESEHVETVAVLRR